MYHHQLTGWHQPPPPLLLLLLVGRVRQHLLLLQPLREE
jgi:hypothetical protein